MVVFTDVKEEKLEKLKELGYKPAAPTTAYEVIRYVKRGVTAIFYSTGKLFLQGSEKLVEREADNLRKIGIGKEKKKEVFRKQEGIFIGSDESLKGDTFGGIVVAAVKASDKERKKLLSLGVADSKLLSDVEILKLAKEIRNLVACSVQSMLPEEYNRQDGVTYLLNKLHKKVAKDLNGGKHVVDKYPGCTVGDIIITKAEQKYVEVAAASILARAAALQQFDYLSMQAGFTIPKGSTHVKLEFRKFVKLHFKNVGQFLENNIK